MPSFFIDRPIFAWVVAILITLVGTISVLNMGIESYPNIAPPQVVVSATYPGANADTMEKNVTQVIEQQLTGIDHLLYFSSSSNSNGTSASRAPHSSTSSTHPRRSRIRHTLRRTFATSSACSS